MRCHYTDSAAVIYCGFPGYLEHGHTSGLDYSYGDTIAHTCGPGHVLRGPANQTCLGSGQWSGGRPVCEEVRCAVPELEHGTVTFDTSDPGGDTVPVGESLAFSCHEGFTLDGAETAECGQEGSLSPSPPICQPIACTLPPM